MRIMTNSPAIQKFKMAKMSVTSSGPSDDSEDDNRFDFSKLKKLSLKIDIGPVKPLRLMKVATRINPHIVESSNLNES